MKIEIIILLVPLLLSKNVNSNDYNDYYDNFFKLFKEVIIKLNFADAYELIEKAIDKLGEIIGDDKLKFAQKIADIIFFSIRVYFDNPEAVAKLTNLLNRLNDLGLLDSKIIKALRGFY